MANNRLFIVDDGNRSDAIMVAKSFGMGWDWRKTPEEMNAYLDRIDPTSYGNAAGSTCLRLVVEADMTEKEMADYMANQKD